MAKPKRTGKKKKAKKADVAGIVHIKSSFNNTVITITDLNGNVVAWSTPGKMGFKGSRKSTPFAAQQAANSVAREVLELGMNAWAAVPLPTIFMDTSDLRRELRVLH